MENTERDIANAILDSHGDIKVKREIKLDADYLKFKPKNSPLSDEEFLLFASNTGLENTLKNEWKEYKYNFTKRFPESTWTTFGELEADCIKAIGERPSQDLPQQEREVAFKEWFQKYKEYISANLFSKDVTQLGKFGYWVAEAGITDKHLLQMIVDEYLEN